MYIRFTSADAWRYQSPKELGHIDYWGLMATFSGGGSIQDLDVDRETTEKIIRVSTGSNTKYMKFRVEVQMYRNYESICG